MAVISSLSNVKKTYTLDDFSAASPSSQLSYYKLCLLEKDPNHNIEYDVYNVLSDYLPELKSMAKSVELTDKEYYTYRYRPKLLADYLYGNGELYFIILWLNDMWNVKDFNSRKIKLISKSDLEISLIFLELKSFTFHISFNQRMIKYNSPLPYK